MEYFEERENKVKVTFEYSLKAEDLKEVETYIEYADKLQKEYSCNCTLNVKILNYY